MYALIAIRSALALLVILLRPALSAIPMMMGMLPTPDGIMLSAPMVRDFGDRIGVERSRQAAINLFFRHQWESVWPLFPAIPLVQGIFEVSAFTLISHNLPIMLAGVLGGVISLLLFGIPPRPQPNPSRNHLGRDLINFAHAFWPIALAGGLYAGFDVPPAAGPLMATLLG